MSLGGSAAPDGDALVGRGRLDDLGEDAAGRGRVKEGYLGAANAGARSLIDQPDAGRAEGLEGLLHRLHAIGDVVKAGTAAGEELPHGGVRAERLEQLDVAVADVEQRRVDPLLLHGLA